jgi:hypothetical protein
VESISVEANFLKMFSTKMHCFIPYLAFSLHFNAFKS